MATITPTIDGKKNSYADGYMCVRTYYCNGKPTQDQEPVRGRPYDALVRDWPSGYRVTNFELEAIVDTDGLTLPLRQAYLMTVNGSTRAGEFQTGQASSSVKLDTIEKDMRGEKFHVDPEMVGARKATERDAGLWKNNGTWVTMPNGWKTPVPVGYNPSDQASPHSFDYAPISGYVYINALSALYYVGNVETSRTPTAGTVRVYPGMPFETRASSNPLTLKYANEDLTVRIFTVTYYVKSNREYSLNAPRDMDDGLVFNWGPRNGRKYGPITVSTPSTSGKWRCLNQKLEPERDEDGAYLIKVIREFIRVPAALGDDARWNRDKFGRWDSDWPA